MVFKRRDKRPFWRTFWELLYPKGGWGRAARYVWHRLRRLPDPPHRIARGVFAGVIVSFTPFFGFHFVAAALISFIIRGNIIAGIMATFFGNPITFPFIAVSSLKLGHQILGTVYQKGADLSLMGKFGGAWQDLRHNFWAMFNLLLCQRADHHRLSEPPQRQAHGQTGRNSRQKSRKES